MKKYIFLILTLLYSSSAMTSRASIDINKVSQKYSKIFFQGKELITLSTLQGSKRVASTVAGQSQTLLLMAILSGVYLVKENLELAKIQRQEMDHEKVLAESKLAAEYLVSSSQLWASLMGGGVATSVLDRTRKFKNFFSSNNTKAKSALKKLLSHAIATNVLFIGWEFGGELFEMSRNLLENDDDYARSENIGKIILSLNDDKKDKALFEKIIRNMYEITINNSEMRELWLWNSFRHKIMTGEFTTLVGSMAGASFLGTMIFPGTGTFVGTLFGLAGGVFSIYIPEKNKNYITNVFQNIRMNFWKSGESGDGFFTYNNVLDTVLEISSNHIERREKLPPLLHLPKQETAFNNILNIYFEKIYKLDSSLQILLDKKKLSEKYENLETLDFYTSEINKVKSKYDLILKNLVQRIQTKVNEYEILLNKHNFYALMDDNEVIKNYQIVEDIKTQYNDLLILSDFLIEDLVLLIKDEMFENIQDKTYSQILHKFHLFGFKKENLLKALKN